MKHALKTDERLRLLLDGNLTPGQLEELETWMTETSGKGNMSMNRIQAIQKLLYELADDPSTSSQPGLVWRRVKTIMDREELTIHPSDTMKNSALVPIIAGLVCCCVALGIGIYWWNQAHPPAPASDGYGKILSLYSFKPDVAATTYESKSGGATIIWLSGADEYPSQFGEIWKVYSFKPEVTATAYDSEKAGATIIWVSGMDDVPKPHRKNSF